MNDPLKELEEWLKLSLLAEQEFCMEWETGQKENQAIGRVNMIKRILAKIGEMSDNGN